MEALINVEHISQFKAGNNSVLGAVYQTYASQLGFVAFRYFKNGDDCKDVVMEVFNKLMKLNKQQRMRIPEDINAFRNWLFMIAKNYCLDVLKHQKIIMDYRQQNQPEYLVEPDVEKKWNAQVINDLLNKLPVSEQKVCTLHFDGYSHEEISDSLNISYNTVRNQLSSGKKKIRKYISDGLIVILVIINFLF